MPSGALVVTWSEIAGKDILSSSYRSIRLRVVYRLGKRKVLLKSRLVDSCSLLFLGGLTALYITLVNTYGPFSTADLRPYGF